MRMLEIIKVKIKFVLNLKFYLKNFNFFQIGSVTGGFDSYKVFIDFFFALCFVCWINKYWVHILLLMIYVLHYFTPITWTENCSLQSSGNWTLKKNFWDLVKFLNLCSFSRIGTSSTLSNHRPSRTTGQRTKNLHKFRNYTMNWTSASITIS